MSLMLIDPKRDIRAGTPEELEDYVRKTGGNEPPEEKTSLIDRWSHAMRGEAKKALRKLDKTPEIDALFNRIVRGGVDGAYVAYRVLKNPDFQR
jgi:hypothetical protein